MAKESCQQDQSHRQAYQTQDVVQEPVAQQIARIFRALADPTRVRILSALAARERCVGDLAATLEMSISAVSHQLRLLRELRVVRNRRQGKHVYYTVDDDHVQDLFERALAHVLHE